METQKIVNSLNGSDIENSKFATKKWYVIDSESNLCDYSDAYVLVTGNITVTGGDANTKVAFKNCAPFRECRAEINETFVDNGEHINIAIPMYNLIEYSNNYSDTSRSLWQFKRDEIVEDVDLILDDDHIPNNSSSFKYKEVLLRTKMV